MTIEEKVKLLKYAEKSINISRTAGMDATLKIGIVDRIYLKIQEMLVRNKRSTLALNPGREETHKNLRDELRDETLTEKTNAVAKEYVTSLQNANTEQAKDAARVN